jgi:hypothetical protein
MQGFVDACHAVSNTDKTGEWARQGSHTSLNSPQKQDIPGTGAAKCAAPSAQAGFANAVAAITHLPLSDEEKAAAVRRLLADKA